MTYDLFFSHRNAEIDDAMPLLEALNAAGVQVFRDATHISTFDGITERIVHGLANSKALLAWYSPAYNESRPCQWELTAAFLAAQRTGRAHNRVLIINPTGGNDHIHPIELRDASHAEVPGNPTELAELVLKLKQHCDELAGTLGDVGPAQLPQQYGRSLTSSHRFVGRLRELWELHTALASDKHAMVAGRVHGPVEVRGLGGVGKSLLVEEYALRFAAAYPGGIFWLSAYGNDDAKAGISPEAREAERLAQLRAFAAKLGLPIADADPLHIEGLLHHAIAAKKERCLWVIDDLPSGLDNATRRKWFGPPGTRTVATTRSQEYAKLGPQLDLDVLDPEDALQLLESAHPPHNPEEETHARALAADLGHHGLAIDVMSGLIALTGGATAYADLRSELANPSEDVLEFAAELGPSLPNGHEKSIAATLLRSVDLAGPHGRDVLRLASVMAAAAIPVGTITVVFRRTNQTRLSTARQTVLTAVDRLRKLSLARLADKTATVHTLVSRTIRRHDADKGRTRALRTSAIATLVDAFAFSASDIRTHGPLERLIPHARELADAPASRDEADLTGWLGRYAYLRGDYESAQRHHSDELDVLRRLLGAEHPDTLASMSNLAVAREAGGDIAGAMELQIQVLAVLRRDLGAEHPDTLVSMSNLAVTRQSIGDLDGALDLLEQVANVERRILAEDDPSKLTSMSNLALVRHASGDLSGALDLQMRALDVQRQVLGDEHPDTLISMNNAAGILQEMGNMHAALDLQMRVLDVQRRVLGEEHPTTLASMNNQALTRQAIGDLDGARELHFKVLEINARTLGEEHPSTLASMTNLALTQHAIGDLDGALELQVRVLEIQRRTLGEEHPSTLTSMNNLAGTRHAKGDTDGALDLHARALEIQRSTLGEDHPSTLASMNNLAGIWHAKGHLAEALDLQIHALELQRRTLGEDHPETLISTGNLVWMLEANGDLDGALDLQARLLKVQRRLLGEEHPDTLASASDLAWMRETNGDLDGALELLQNVRDVQHRVLGPRHDSTVISTWCLLKTHEALGDMAGLKRALSDLLWLLDTTPAELSADQRTVRAYLLRWRDGE